MKDTITTKELVWILLQMKNGRNTFEIFKELEPSATVEHLHFLSVKTKQRVDRNLDNDVPTTDASAAGEVLTEELDSPTMGPIGAMHALGMLLQSEYQRGMRNAGNKLMDKLIGGTSDEDRLPPEVRAIVELAKATGAKVQVMDIGKMKGGKNDEQ